MTPHGERLARHSMVTAVLASMSDAELNELLGRRARKMAGIGGSTQAVRIAGTPVCVMLVGLTGRTRHPHRTQPWQLTRQERRNGGSVERRRNGLKVSLSSIIIIDCRGDRGAKGCAILNRDELAAHLPSWRDGTARQSLTAFLHQVTAGPDALPIADRVAAFDNDGTLACEKPHTALAAFLADPSGRGSPAASAGASGHQVLRDLGALFQGKTTTEYQDQARTFLSRALHPRFVRPYPSLTYRPMLELIALLHRLEFSVFMCTDSSRDFIRVIAGSAYGLTRDHIIGSEVTIESIQGRLVRTATPVPLDDGPGKTVHLWDRTGTQPVLAAGNAAGDIAMLQAAQFRLVVHHDDSVREYAYQDHAILDAAKDNGWTVLSMREDFTHLWPFE